MASDDNISKKKEPNIPRNNSAGGITRRPLRKYEGRLKRIESHKPYMVVPEEDEEEDGEIIDEAIESHTSKDEESSPSCSDEDVSSHQIFIEDDIAFVDIGQGIQLKTTKELAKQLDCVKAIKWTMKDRNAALQVPNIAGGMRFISPNIYQIDVKMAKKIANICNRHEHMLPKDKRCVFSLADEFKEHITFRVPVDKSLIYVEGDEDVCTFHAYVECREKVWKIHPAVVKDGYVEFKCCRLNSFGIVRSTKQHGLIVKPSGSKIVSGDEKLIAEFEAGTVEIVQKIDYSIQRPDKSYLQKSSDPQRLVIAASDKISLVYDKSQFKKRMKLSGSLKSEMESGSDFESIVKIVTYQNMLPVIMDPIPTQTTTGEYQCNVECFDSAAIVKFKKDRYNQIDFPKKLQDELELLYGNKMLCHILLFYVNKPTSNVLAFSVECCLSKNLDTIKENHKKDGHLLIFTSRELILPPQQRIRIRPTGCLRHRQGIEPHCFLFFMYVASENCAELSAAVTKSLGASCNAVIQFSADNQGKGDIAQAEFSIDNLYNPTRRTQLQRSNTFTLCNDNFLPKIHPVYMPGHAQTEASPRRQKTTLF